MGRLMNIMIPLQQIIIGFRDLIGKIQGTMTAGLFTLLGSYYALKALMGAIAQFIIIILIALAAMIAMFWIFPFTWGVAIANTSIFVALAIPMAIILAFMSDVMHVQVGGGLQIPSIKCFDKGTLIRMSDGIDKPIDRVCVGDTLLNGNVVTAKVCVTAAGSEMYSLHKVVVSDSHIVSYNGTWIPVSEHPDAIRYGEYHEELLYCLNTSNKCIEINGITFTDWDEIHGSKLEQVMNVLPHGSKMEDIHSYLDSGFASGTIMRLLNGEYKEIYDVNVNDVLENGEKVYGIVEINGVDLEGTFSYVLGEKNLVEGYVPSLKKSAKERISKKEKLYHLLTDKGTFQIGDVVIKDYNHAIDRFLL
jgi:hypothetical protein